MPALNEEFVPHLGRTFKFQDRSSMRPPFVGRVARLPRDAAWSPPATPSPVDSTGDARVVCPMFGNDRYGDCGIAMVAHADQILTFRQGKGTQSTFDVNALVRQYLAVSGGDNGLYEHQVVDLIWKVGIAGNRDAIIVDALDIDLTDDDLVRFCLDQFYTVQMGWSVPNAFRNGFATGSVWSAPGRPNPRLGHYVPLADVGGADTPVPDVGEPTGGGRTRRAVDAAMIEAECHPRAFGAGGGTLDGFYRLWTWGSWCWVSPAFVASVNPDGFVAFSPRQFDAAGLDAKGRHITTQAALWRKMGGNPIPASLIARYPAAPPAIPAIDWSAWN